MPFPEQKPGTLTNTLEKIKSEKVAQNCWPILAQFNWPLTGAQQQTLFAFLNPGWVVAKIRPVRLLPVPDHE
jgi:hypothetical protein